MAAGDQEAWLTEVDRRLSAVPGSLPSAVAQGIHIMAYEILAAVRQQRARQDAPAAVRPAARSPQPAACNPQRHAAQAAPVAVSCLPCSMPPSQPQRPPASLAAPAPDPAPAPSAASATAAAQTPAAASARAYAPAARLSRSRPCPAAAMRGATSDPDWTLDGLGLDAAEAAARSGADVQRTATEQAEQGATLQHVPARSSRCRQGDASVNRQKSGQRTGWGL